MPRTIVRAVCAHPHVTGPLQKGVKRRPPADPCNCRFQNPCSSEYAQRPSIGLVCLVHAAMRRRNSSFIFRWAGAWTRLRNRRRRTSAAWCAVNAGFAVFGQRPHGGVPETAHQVIVDQPHGLHEGIADRRADEVEAAFLIDGNPRRVEAVKRLPVGFALPEDR